MSVALVLAISATSVFLMRQYFLSLPNELEEAAKIDGAGFFTTFSRVHAAARRRRHWRRSSVLTFQGTWNSFFWPLILLRDQAYSTLPLGLVQFRSAGGFSTDWPPLMATVVMATIPIVVLYLFFQRYFVERAWRPPRSRADASPDGRDGSRPLPTQRCALLALLRAHWS